MESKKNLWITSIVVGVLVVGFIVWGSISFDADRNDNSVIEDEGIIYYFGAECPHCQDVKRVIEEKNLRQSVDFSEKEVWHNKANDAEMRKRAKKCNLRGYEIGVPFLYSGGKCFVGAPDVIKELESQAESIEKSDESVE